MRKPDTQKTADELLSDSCFGLLGACNNRIREVEAKLKALVSEAKTIEPGSAKERANDGARREAMGELFGLAYMQGALEVQCRSKMSLAEIARWHKAV